jgi:hypothetical protein
LKFVRFCVLISFLAFPLLSHSQTPKALFDNTLNETAGNADWIIDVQQPVPVPAQSGITGSTPETYWTGAISAWGVDLVKLGFTVHTLTASYGITYGNAGNPYDLSNYKLFVVCEPQNQFTAAEKTAIRTFVQNGGGLMMVGDHTSSDRDGDGWDSPEVWNDLGSDTYFGIHFQSTSESNANITQNATNVETSPTDSIIHGPAGTVTCVSYHNGTTMNILTANNPTAVGRVWMNGAPHGTTQTIVATARYGLGKVAAVGDSSPADDSTGQSGNNLYNGWTDPVATNNIAFLNLSLWLTSSPPAVPPGAVTLVTPADGATGISAPSLFRWNSTQNTTAYELQISTSGVFATTFYSDTTITDTSRSVGGFALNTIYFWRVRGKNGAGWGTYSTTRSFTTWNVPPAVTLVAPVDGAPGVAIPTVLTWNGSPTATGYGIDISTQPDFSSFVFRDSLLTDTTGTCGSLNLNTPYYWKVRARNAAGWGAYSPTYNFTTWNTPPLIVLDSPSDSAPNVPLPVAVRWRTSAEALVYRLDVTTDETFPVEVFSDSTIVDTAYVLTSIAPGNGYLWTVTGKNDAGWGPSATPRSFSTWNLPGQVSLISPSDGEGGLENPVQLLWHALDSAFSFQLQVSTDDLFSQLIVDDSTLADTSASIIIPDSLQVYHWRVRGLGAAGWGSFSASREFSLFHLRSLVSQFGARWNLVSVPLIVGDRSRSSVFPTATIGAFAFEDGYVQKDSLSYGVGYWLKFPDPVTDTLNGGERVLDSVLVHEGWNLIGTLPDPVPVDSITSVPPGIISSRFYGYEEGYGIADTLLPFRGYWVKTEQDGILILR